jgi:chromosome partitioning protein
MPARIITIANQKGGCGKTTVTMTLAGALAANKLRVIVVDADRQGSASTWSANAPDDKPFPARVMNLAMAGKALGSEIKKFLDDADVILIDCPPAVDSPLPMQALVISDVVLVPLLPSPTDFAAAQTFFELINSAMNLNPTLQVRVVPNMVQKTALTTSYMGAVANLPFPRTQAEIGHRVSYKEAAALGCSIDELPGAAGSAKSEVKRLVAEVLPMVGFEEAAKPAKAKAPRAPKKAK